MMLVILGVCSKGAHCCLRQGVSPFRRLTGHNVFVDSARCESSPQFKLKEIRNSREKNSKSKNAKRLQNLASSSFDLESSGL